MNQFRSILKEAKFELVEKKSKFIGSVCPVKSENEALEFIKKVGSIHRDASHNVFAYIISGPTEIQKASDDGEPQGTAGIPVLEVIKRERLTNVCIVVTRYFGGILLGAGGLIRAYSSAARGGLEAGSICTMSLFTVFSVFINYPALGKVQNIVTTLGNTILNIEYTESVKIFVKSKYDMVENTISKIIESTNGEAVIKRIENLYGKG